MRGSAGSVFRVPIVREAVLTEAAAQVRRSGGQVWATGNAGENAFSWTPAEPVLLLLGAEGVGLSKAAATVAENGVSIPLQREVESLNVAVAAGVLLYAFRQSR